MADRLTQRQIKEAVEELDALCRDEYGEDRSYGLLELLDDPDRQLAQIRLQRLTGIALKGKFAERESASSRIRVNPTATADRRCLASQEHVGGGNGGVAA
jgi:hypothetical protein